jgi:8-oxo-dGTP pyrophosphatase MutT (NUDIX family)
MSVSGAGLFILHPKGDSVLLIRDDRHNKWSFPKGRKEDTDADLYATAIRETYEETGFQKDVHYILGKSGRSFGKAHIIVAYALTSDLPFTSCPTHHVAEVAWIPLKEIGALDANMPLRLAFKQGWIYR